jgi:F-type H+-transporting ATPase subunit alpha
VAIIYALNHGYLDDLEPAQIRAWERDLYVFLRNQHPEILASIRDSKDLSSDNEKALGDAIARYKELFADPSSPIGTENYANSAILNETDSDRRMGEEQLRLASRPEGNAASSRQSY